MKKFYRLIICILTLVLLISLASCENVLDNIVENLPEYEYSEDGIEEAEDFFSPLQEEDFSGSVSYKISSTIDSEIDEEYLFTMSSYIDENSESLNKKSLVEVQNTQNNEDFSYLFYENDESYFINHNEKTVTRGVQRTNILHLFYYGTVEFETTNGQNWEFVEKRNVQVKDSEGEEKETVEFEYNKIGDEDDLNDTKLKINFDKKIPSIIKMSYEIFNAEQEETQVVDVYITDISTTVEESKFTLPDEDDGYTLIEE